MTVPLGIRKFRSLLLRASRRFASCIRILIIRLTNDGAMIPWSTNIERDVDMRITDGGGVRLGSGCTIEAGTKIISQGARIDVGGGTFVGRGATLVARQSIKIGADVLIAEYVSIRDQNHIVDCFGPMIHSGFYTSPIEIGDDVWIGAKATILPGARLGAGSVIGAHALVRADIPERAIAVGIPSRVMRFRQSGADE